MILFKKLVFKLGKKYLLAQFETDDFRNKIVSIVNERVDIPKLNEKQEKQLFDAIYSALVAYIRAK